MLALVAVGLFLAGMMQSKPSKPQKKGPVDREPMIRLIRPAAAARTAGSIFLALALVFRDLSAFANFAAPAAAVTATLNGGGTARFTTLASALTILFLATFLIAFLSLRRILPAPTSSSAPTIVSPEYSSSAPISSSVSPEMACASRRISRIGTRADAPHVGR
jgi:hypothetical protein